MNARPDVPSSPARAKRTPWLRIVLPAVLLLALLLVAVRLPLRDYLLSLLAWTRGLGFWGPVVVVSLYVLAGLFLIPGWILTVGSGFVFGVALGTATVSVGSTLGAGAAFIAGRTLAREWVARKVADNPKFLSLDEAVGRQGFKLVLLLRLSPLFPYNLLNYALGLTRVSFGAYLLGSWLGMLPATLVYVYLGSAARSLTAIAARQAPEGWMHQVVFWLGLAATLAAAGLMARIASKSLKSGQKL